MRTLTPKHLDTEGDQIVLNYEDDHGEKYEAKIGTMDAATLISALGKLIEEISQNPTYRNPMMPGMNFVQLLERENEVWLRISIGEHGLFHDYPVPNGTTLADDLRFLADRVAARQEAKVTNPQSDDPARRN
jgi:hypothetical protein